MCSLALKGRGGGHNGPTNFKASIFRGLKLETGTLAIYYLRKNIDTVPFYICLEVNRHSGNLLLFLGEDRHFVALVLKFFCLAEPPLTQACIFFLSTYIFE